MAEPRTYHQFKKIVRATAEKGSADIILANVKDDKQMKDLISLYEMQKATKTFDRVEYADLLREVADPLGQTWNMSGKDGSQGPLQPKEKKEVGRDEIADLINQVQSEPKKKKISAEKLLGEKPKKKSAAISADKLVPPKEGKDDADEVSPKTDENKRGKKKGVTAKGVDQLAVNLNVIAKELTAINVLLARQLKNDERRAKKMAQEARKEERDKKEKESESLVKKVGKKVFDTIKKPFESFFQKILRFLTNIVLGTAVIGILDWLKKPENQQKVENFTNFIIDQIPLILTGLAGILALKIGSKIFKVLKLLYNLSKAFIGLARRSAKMAKGFIDRLRGNRTPGGRNVSGSGTGSRGRGRVTTSGGRVIQRGRFRGLGRGGFVGALALAGVEIFKPEIQDLVGGLYSQFGIGIRAQGDDDLIENALKLDTELDEMYKNFKDLPNGELLFESASSQMADEYGIYMRELTRRGLIDENGNIKGTTTSVDPGDMFGDVNYNLDLGLGELENDVRDVEGGGLSATTPTDVSSLQSPTSNFGEGIASELTPMNALTSTMTGMSGQMNDFSSAMTGMSDIGSSLFGMDKETPMMKIKGLSSEETSRAGAVLSSPSMFSGNQNMLYDVPTPKHFSETIIAPTAGGEESGSGAAAMSSGARNDPPRFSPFDSNNPTLGPVLSVYNALV